MRTAILGVFRYQSLQEVRLNTLDACKTTHADPRYDFNTSPLASEPRVNREVAMILSVFCRCQASCVAVTHAIALMLQKSPQHFDFSTNTYRVDVITTDAYNEAVKCLEQDV